MRNGKALESLQECLKICIRKLDVQLSRSSKPQSTRRLSSHHSFDSALPEVESRCQSLFFRILQPHYQGARETTDGRQDTSVNLLVAFFTSAWINLASVPDSLKQSFEQPHKLLTCIKLLKDACTLAIGQLQCELVFACIR